jgi:hypothetical protein
MIGRQLRTGGIATVFVVDAEFSEAVSACRWCESNGYLVGSPCGRSITLHRFVWELKFGAVPEMLDHINQVRLDCRISNLRPATKSLNGRNMTRRRTKYHGIPRGVSFRPTYRKQYVVEIKVHGMKRCLGSFSTAEEASAVYEAAAAQAICAEEMAARSRFSMG